MSKATITKINFKLKKAFLLLEEDLKNTFVVVKLTIAVVLREKRAQLFVS